MGQEGQTATRDIFPLPLQLPKTRKSPRMGEWE